MGHGNLFGVVMGGLCAHTVVIVDVDVVVSLLLQQPAFSPMKSEKCTVRSEQSWCDGGLNNGKNDLRRGTPLLLPLYIYP